MFTANLKNSLSRIAKLSVMGSGGYFTWNYWINSRNAQCEPLEVDTAKGTLGDKQDFHLTLFQYQTCPFCSKVRAFMDYYGLSYNVVEVNPLFRTETKFSSYKKIPFLLYNDKQELQKKELLLPDSSLIVSVLKTSLLDSNSKKEHIAELLRFYPEFENNIDGKKKQDFGNKYFVMYGTDQGKDNEETVRKEAEWRKWVDDILVHTLAPNIYQTPKEAIRTFKYLAEAGEWDRLFPSWQVPVVVYVGATTMYVIAKGLKKRYKLKDDVRISLYEACDQWVKALESKPFMGGKQPNLADLAAYGVLNAIEGCDAFQDLIRNTKISQWYQRMKTEVTNHNGAKVISVKASR